MSAQTISLDLIRTDGGTQPRQSNDEATIKAYGADMAEGAEFPPLIVFHDGAEYWLADGFHRFFAAKGANLDQFPCDVRQGARRDAILFSVGANAAHGLRRSNDDKRKAVLTLLQDEEWSKWSDREIARQCAVSPDTVGRVKRELESAGVTVRSDSERTYTDRHGNTSTMNTAAIGKRAEVEDETSAAAPDASEPAQTAPVDPPDPERKKLAKLTREALEDEVIGLRADLADAKRKSAERKAEIERMKSDLAAFRQDDMGRALGNAQRAARAAEGRMKEHQSAAVRLDRQVKALKAENADLKSTIENQLITMD